MARLESTTSIDHNQVYAVCRIFSHHPHLFFEPIVPNANDVQADTAQVISLAIDFRRIDRSDQQMQGESVSVLRHSRNAADEHPCSNGWRNGQLCPIG